LTKSGIAKSSFVYSPGGSIELAITCFGWGFTRKSAFSLRVRDPTPIYHNVLPHKCTCQMASKSVERFKQVHECETDLTDDLRTDHATEKYVETGGIACAAGAILPNNNNKIIININNK